MEIEKAFSSQIVHIRLHKLGISFCSAVSARTWMPKKSLSLLERVRLLNKMCPGCICWSTRFSGSLHLRPARKLFKAAPNRGAQDAGKVFASKEIARE